MMKLFRALTYCSIFLIVIYSCKYDSGDDLSKKNLDLNLNLRWVKSHSGERKENIITGLAWALSFLGANLPEGSLNSSIRWMDDSHFIIDFHKVGFSDNAEMALGRVIEILKQSEEYKIMKGIDLGRFIMVTLNSPRHYYKITEAESTIDNFREKLNWISDRVAIINSSVSFGNRIIEISEVNDVLDLAFIAKEGHGSLLNDDFVATETEAFRVMPNGQLRFLLYDDNGNLKDVADSVITIAGKPSKCLWCHETNIQPTYSIQPKLEKFISTSEFIDVVTLKMKQLEEYRKTIKSDIDFNRKQDHTFTELLYIGFMEPSAERLSIEWGISLKQVKEMLSGLPTHQHHEFPYLGELYDRKIIESKTPYKSVRVPDSTRDYSNYEPDFFK